MTKTNVNNAERFYLENGPYKNDSNVCDDYEVQSRRCLQRQKMTLILSLTLLPRAHLMHKFRDFQAFEFFRCFSVLETACRTANREYACQFQCFTLDWQRCSGLLYVIDVGPVAPVCPMFVNVYEKDLLMYLELMYGAKSMLLALVQTTLFKDVALLKTALFKRLESL